MTSPLSVGIVCFPSLGGSGVVASEQAVGLAKLGHRVRLISTAPPARTLPACERLTFHKVELPEYPLFDHAPYTVALASSLTDLARADRLDVVHVHYAVPHAASAYLARQALGARAFKVVTSLHGTDVWRVGSQDAYRSITSFAVAQSDGVVVPSEFLKREAFRLLKLPDALPVEVIPNFVDADHFSPDTASKKPGQPPVLFHVSNFRPVKRVVDTVEVLARVRRQLPARLVLVGEGPQTQAVVDRAKQLGVAEHVELLGRRTEFLPQLRQADAFLLPSEMESFGVAALESMSVGVPVFGYEVGGLPEVVTPEAGRLVRPFDLDALADAVVRVVSSPEEHAELRRTARARALERYPLAPAIRRYESYLQRVVEKVRAG